MNFPDLVKQANSELGFVYQQKEKIKKLSGYQSNRHFLPKYYSKSLVSFINNISVKDIEESFSPVAENIRDKLGLKINDYSFCVNQTDGGVFDCSQFNLSMFYFPDENNLSEVFLNLQLNYKNRNYSRMEQVLDLIPYSFQYVKFALSAAFSLRDFIDQYEEFFNKKQNQIRSHYDLNATEFEIDFVNSGKKIALTENEIKIYFSSQFTVSDFIENYIYAAK